MDSLSLSTLKALGSLGLGLMLFGAPRLGHAASETHPDYLQAVQQELARLSLDAKCNPAADLCTFATPLVTQDAPLELTVRYSSETDTIYIGFDHFLTLEGSPPPTLTLRLLSLNRDMVSAKFSFDADTLAVRLSTSLNTDSNFDRRAFRSQIKGLLEIAEKLAPSFAMKPADTATTMPTDSSAK